MVLSHGWVGLAILRNRLEVVIRGMDRHQQRLLVVASGLLVRGVRVITSGIDDELDTEAEIQAAGDRAELGFGQ